MQTNNVKEIVFTLDFIEYSVGRMVTLQHLAEQIFGNVGFAKNKDLNTFNALMDIKVTGDLSSKNVAKFLEGVSNSLNVALAKITYVR